jgi:FkbM family methyltransferase
MWQLLSPERVGARSLHVRPQLHLDPRRGWDLANVAEIYEQDQFRLSFLADRIQPRTVVDIGANIGLFSALVPCLWPNASTIAIEPDTSLHAQLGLNAPETRRIAAAVYYGSDAVRFERDRLNPSLSKVSQNGPETVPAVTIEDLVPEIDLLKMDCEGSEWNILANMTVRPLVIVGEWHDRPGVDLSAILSEKGYHVLLYPLQTNLGLFVASLDIEITGQLAAVGGEGQISIDRSNPPTC